MDTRGRPSAYSCPDCNGVLWEVEDGGQLRFRCRVGHAFATDSLIALQTEKTEDALWAAVRALEEKASLNRRVAKRFRERNTPRSADRLERLAAEAVAQAENVRRLIEIEKVVEEN